MYLLRAALVVLDNNGTALAVDADFLVDEAGGFEKVREDHKNVVLSFTHHFPRPEHASDRWQTAICLQSGQEFHHESWCWMSYRTRVRR